MIQSLDWLLLRAAAIIGLVIALRYLAPTLRWIARLSWSLAAGVDAFMPAFRAAWRSETFSLDEYAAQFRGVSPRAAANEPASFLGAR